MNKTASTILITKAQNSTNLERSEGVGLGGVLSPGQASFLEVPSPGGTNFQTGFGDYQTVHYR